jgi:UDP-N-acetylglucosamine acyltransferase
MACASYLCQSIIHRLCRFNLISMGNKESIIHPTAIIYDNVIIEDGVFIGPYCVIGAEPEWKGKESEGKGVYIMSGTRITGLVTIDSGAEDVTIIGKNCYIMKHSHVGHDAIIKNGVTISCGAKVGGHSIIGENTNVGLNAVIHQKVKVPSGCMIGMGAVITKNTELNENCKYAGVPAKFIGYNDRHNIPKL